MFPDADAAANISSSSSGGQLESASPAAGSGSPGAQSPGGESCSSSSSSVPATAAEGDDEEDDDEETPATPERGGLSRSMLAAAGLGLLLAVSLFHLGRPRAEEEAPGGQQGLALLLLRLLFYLGCAAGSFFLGTLLALLGRRRGRLWPPPGSPAAWSRRYPGKDKADPLLQAAAMVCTCLCSDDAAVPAILAAVFKLS
ncbi:UNVERIFIED_CONTAM: hypothetical protein K2H54_054889 [Gekko kuhli]